MAKRESLRSKSLRSARYDAERHELELEWSSGRVYRYFDVPPSVYAWFERARSKGAFVNRLVKDKYRYEEVVDTTGSQTVGDPGDSASDLAAQLMRSLQPPDDEK